jgi:hypothetical protein
MRHPAGLRCVDPIRVPVRFSGIAEPMVTAASESMRRSPAIRLFVPARP